MIRRALAISAVATAVIVPAVPARAGASCPPGNFADRATNRVDMKGDCFVPVVARVEPGDEVTFRNVDSHDHTVGGVAGTFGEAHEPISAGETIAFRFDEEGIYPFFCIMHPGMAGAVVVGDGSASGAASGVAAPAKPASAAKNAGPVNEDVPVAMTILIVVAALGAAGIVTLALRRRRALGTAA